MKKEIHKGQVAMVLVLIMTVVSVLAVSLASRSTIDTKIQQSESESVQAFLFAQTGIEQLIMNPSNTSAEGSDYFSQKFVSGTSSVDVGLLEVGSSIELNLEPTNASLTGFNVYWNPGSSGGQPALFISLVESTGKIADYAYDYNGVNNFTAASAGPSGFAKKLPANILLTTSIVRVRIMVLGASAILKVVPVGSVFPSQITSIKSTGTVQSAENKLKYGLQYDESANDSVPSVFDYALFSSGSINQ